VSAALALRGAISRLRQAGIPDPVRDARLLLAHAMGIGADRLTLALHDPLHDAALARFDAAIDARAARRPVSHILGQRAFWGRDFIVTADVLDPRPETETLIAAALNTRFSRLLDLGTGSGAIILTLLAEVPHALGIGVDLSAAALAVAQENATALAVQGRVELIQSDWFDAVNGRFDLIVSNPPYIAAHEMADLAPEVREHEPRIALTPGGDGLQAYRVIAAGAAAHMTPQARLLLEIGPTQAQAVSQMLTEAGFAGVQTLRDLDGRDRVIQARWPG